MRGMKLRYELYAKIKTATREIDSILSMLPKKETLVEKDVHAAKAKLSDAGLNLKNTLDEFERNFRRK